MKRTMKTLLALCLCLTLALGLCGTALAAESSVSYDGTAKSFTFDTGANLFVNFEGIMPGDTLTEKVTVTISGVKEDYAVICIKAIPHDETENPLSTYTAETEDIVSMSDFLAQLHMTVECGGKVIFDAAPSETAQFTDNVMLISASKGTKNKSVEMTVTLEVPAELGNEYANRRGEVDWQFTVCDFTKSPIPTTGDSNNIFLYAAIVVISLCGVAAVIFILRKKDKQ